MKTETRFPMQVVAVLVVVGAAAVYPLMRFGSDEVLRGVIAGAVLSTVNALLGFLTIEFAYGKSYTTFLKAVLGGMALRLALMLGTLAVLIKVFQYHVLALTMSLLGLYLVYLVLEIFYLQKKVAVKH